MKKKVVEKPKGASFAPPPQFTSWSFSRLKDWEQCPLRAKLGHLDKVPAPKHPAAERGTLIHASAEAFLRGSDELHPALEPMRGELLALRNNDARPEGKLSFTNTWTVADWLSAWVRMIVDVHVPLPDGTAHVVDFKTGKVYSDHDDQMALYALGTFAAHDDVQVVKTSLWYVDQAVRTVPTEFRRDEHFAGLKTYWETRVAFMMLDRSFAPRPGPKCRWCAYSKSALGKCIYG